VAQIHGRFPVRLSGTADAWKNLDEIL